MEEALVREKLKELILDNGLKAFIHMPSIHKDEILSLCVSYSEVDWLFEKRVMDRIMAYVLSNDVGDAVALAREIKVALSNYYETILEDMFDEVKSQIEYDRNTEAGLRQQVDPINGEVRWVR